MSKLEVLGLFTALLFFGCWSGAILALPPRKDQPNKVADRLWRLLVIFAPIGGFLIQVLFKSRRRQLAGGRTQALWALVSLHGFFIVFGFTGLAIARNAVVLDVRQQRVVRNYEEEWWHARRQGPPQVCLAMSGGGIRSAAFNIGVLQGLHESGVLKEIDVMSAVSGGSYALSWFLLQQYYVQQEAGLAMDTDTALRWMFDPKEKPQQHLAERARQFGASSTGEYYSLFAFMAAADAVGFNFVRAADWYNPNENRLNAGSFGRSEYRASLQRTFQELRHPKTGALLNGHHPSPMEAATNTDLTSVTRVSFPDLARFAQRKGLPFFIFNTTVLVDQENRDSALWKRVFELNGWGLGSDSYWHSPWNELERLGARSEAVRLVNVAPAISGAAVSPASLKDDSRLRMALTLGNIDMGYLIPRFKEGDRGSLFLTDGGHSENLGVYSLVRRGCRNIIAVDAEEERSDSYRFESYTNVKKALDDEKLELQILTIDHSEFKHRDPVVFGTIKSKEADRQEPSAPTARVAYIKLAMDKTLQSTYPRSVSDPGLGPKFPQDPTRNQNFSPEKFVAYRDLGQWIVTQSKELEEWGKVAHSASRTLRIESPLKEPR